MGKVVHIADKVSVPASPPIPMLGERLLQANRITRDQLQIALHEQRHSSAMLGSILVRLGFLEEEMLAAMLAERTGLGQIDLKTTSIDAALLRRLPKAVAQRCRALPVRLEN